MHTALIRLARGLAVVSIAGFVSCSLGPSPRKDLKERIKTRMQEHPFFDLVGIKKYVKEETQGNIHEFYYRIEYTANTNCVFDGMRATGPADVTIDNCVESAKKLGGGFAMPIRIAKGSKVVEVASLAYANNKLSEVEFRSINAVFGFERLELEK